MANKEKKSFKLPHLFWIMMGLLVVTSLLTYVVPAGATDVEIVVDTAVQQQVEGTMKVYLASNAGNEIVTDLSKLTFNGANLANATVDADGTISFTLNTGIYAVEYVDGGYDVATLTVDGVTLETRYTVSVLVTGAFCVPVSVADEYPDLEKVALTFLCEDLFSATVIVVVPPVPE